MLGWARLQSSEYAWLSPSGVQSYSPYNGPGFTYKNPPGHAGPSPVRSNELLTSDVDEFNDLSQLLKSNEVYKFETEISKTADVKGNLKKHLGFWVISVHHSFIRDPIENGYKLPFMNLPEPATFKNNRSSKLHAQFIENAILEINESGRFIECHEPRWSLVLCLYLFNQEPNSV